MTQLQMQIKILNIIEVRILANHEVHKVSKYKEPPAERVTGVHLAASGAKLSFN